MIIINLEAAQIQIGTSTPYLNLPYHDYECLLPHSWVKSLWRFMYTYGITLTGPISTPSTSRRNDSNIIEQVVSNYPNLHQDELQIFNNCRLFLQVHSLSGIATGDGRRITGNSLQGHRDQDRQSTLVWPTQQRPADRYWKIWRKLLRHTYTDNTYWSIKRPLGSWIKLSHHEHRWYCDEDITTIYYKHSEQSFRQYTRMDGPRLRQSNKYRLSGLTTSLPTYYEKTTIRRTQNGHIRFEGSAPSLPLQAQQHPITIEDRIQTQNQWIQDILRIHEWPEDMTNICNALHQGTLEAVADGSYKKSLGLGTTAWIVTTADSSTECTGASQVPGNPDIMESYRVEIYGILSIIVFIDLIADHFHIDEGHIAIACENIEAGKNTLQNWTKHSPQVKHFDLLWLTWTKRRNKKIKWTYQHVKGHQDRHSKNLDKWERRNIRMDETAKRYM